MNPSDPSLRPAQPAQTGSLNNAPQTPIPVDGIQPPYPQPTQLPQQNQQPNPFMPQQGAPAAPSNGYPNPTGQAAPPQAAAIPGTPPQQQPAQPAPFSALDPTIQQAVPNAPAPQRPYYSGTAQMAHEQLQAQQAQTPKESVNAMLVVLQWLTYAFWGWTILALSILTAMVLSSFIAKADTGSFTPYGIAAVLVLLPIAFTCDYFYSKKEPEKKTGAETIVTVIHAVIFALCGIGALITAVFFIVQLFTSNSSDQTGIIVGILSAFIVAFFYLITFLRTLNPSKLPQIKHYYKFVMLALVGIIAILGIVGPVAAERSTRNDRLIQSGLSDLSSSINDYVDNNKKLPSQLSDITASGDAKKLIDDNMVRYKAVDSAQTSASKQSDRLSQSTGARQSSDYRYELCVTYSQKSRSYDDYNEINGRSYKDSDGYSSYLSVYSHPAGEVCYKLKTTSYN